MATAARALLALLALAGPPAAGASGIVLSSWSLSSAGEASQSSTAEAGRAATGAAVAASGEAAASHFDKSKYMENSIITSLNNCPLCREKEPCLLGCRQQEQKPWGECLNRCLGDNPMLLDTFQGLVQSTSKRLHGFGQ